MWFCRVGGDLHSQNFSPIIYNNLQISEDFIYYFSSSKLWPMDHSVNERFLNSSDKLAL